jgi:hypothetical protein
MNTDTRYILDWDMHYRPEYMALHDWKFPLPNTTTVMLRCIYPLNYVRNVLIIILPQDFKNLYKLYTLYLIDINNGATEDRWTL